MDFRERVDVTGGGWNSLMNASSGWLTSGDCCVYGAFYHSVGVTGICSNRIGIGL
jgi:hypothetical protein